MSAISTTSLTTSGAPAPVTKSPSRLSADMTAAENSLIAFFSKAAAALSSVSTATAATAAGAASATNLLGADLQGLLAVAEASIMSKLGATWGPLAVTFVSSAVQVGTQQVQSVLTADGLGSVLTGIESIVVAFGLLPTSPSPASSASPAAAPSGATAEGG